MADDDTRKRVHQEDEVETSLPKRAAISVADVPDPALSESDHHSLDGTESFPPEFQEVHCFKLLCPQTIVGVIIGKGGTVINQLIAATGARIKLSQTNEFFPMTTDRVLMINGSRDCLQSALTDIVTRMSEVPDRRGYHHDMSRDRSEARAAASLQIKVLIPKSSSAAVIGKQGVVIRRLSELSGCHFTLGDEADPYGTRERMVCVQGTSTSTLITGVQMLMNELLDDVSHRNYSNPTTNYSNLMGCGYSRPPPSMMQISVSGGALPVVPHVQGNMLPMHHHQQQRHVMSHLPPSQPVYYGNSEVSNSSPYMVHYHQQGPSMQQQQQQLSPPQQPLTTYSSPPPGVYPNGPPPQAVYHQQPQPMYGSPPLMPLTPPPAVMPMHPQYHHQHQVAAAPPEQIPYGMMSQNGITTRGGAMLQPQQQQHPGYLQGGHQQYPPAAAVHHQQIQSPLPPQPRPGGHLYDVNQPQPQPRYYNPPAQHAGRPPTAPTMGYPPPQQQGLLPQPQQQLQGPPPFHQPLPHQQQHYPPPQQQQYRGSPSPAITGGEQHYHHPSYQSQNNNNHNGFARRGPQSAGGGVERGGGSGSGGGAAYHHSQQQQQQWQRGGGRRQRKE